MKPDAFTAADQRILARLDRDGDCWTWIGKSVDVQGRARVWYNGKAQIHHRAVWQILVGPIPDGAYLCHHCDNPSCANPAHLYVGDARSNVRDMVSRGRSWSQKHPEKTTIYRHSAQGAAARNAKLTAEQRSRIGVLAGLGRARSLSPERRRQISIAAGQASKLAREARMGGKCGNGHPMNGDNVAIRKNGQRECKACSLARALKSRDRAQAKAMTA